jgi:hypothetical protein
LRHDRGVSITVELDGEDAEVRLLRERKDGTGIEPPDFAETRAGERLSFSTGVQATGYAERSRIVVTNTSTGLLTPGTVRVTQDDDVPPHPVGAIIRADHHSEVAVSPGRGSAKVWLPLPVNHGAQVPLDVNPRLEPADAGTIELVRHGPTNWGLLARFEPSARHPRVVIAWTATVLVRDVLPAERVHFYPETAGDEAWLQATISADAQDARARAIAERLIANAGDEPSQRLSALLAWLSGLEPPAQSAVGAPNDDSNRASALLVAPARANCTGTTNVASALGRALGIPTRHVAGILTGEAMMTHAVNEFLVGNPRTWVRIEPQTGETVAQDYMVVLRVVPTHDEGPASIDRERWGAPGVPMYSLVEAVDERTRLVLADETDHFPDCPRCDNGAERLAVLQDTSLQRIEQLHARARELWERDRTRWITSANEQAASVERSRAADVDTLDELERLLDDIERER